MIKETELQKNIKNAFSLVSSVYKETAFMIKDLEKEVAIRGFYPANKATGAKYGASYDRPEDWLASFTCRYWIEKAPGKLQKTGPNITYLGCSAIFAASGQAIEPLFAYGVFQAMDSPKASFYHEWVTDVVHNNGGNFAYWRSRDKKEYNLPLADRETTVFQCRLADASYSWPKHGIVVAFPLTDIHEPKEISDLADQIKALWQERLKLMVFPEDFVSN